MSTENKNVKEETKTEHAHGEEGHVHGENCNHEHDHDKSGKGEKKVRKALAKLGMTRVESVNRVTIRQKDNYILIVKDPEVYTSAQTENAYIIFGEITFEDSEKTAKDAVERLKADGDKLKTETVNLNFNNFFQTGDKKEEVEIVDETAEVSEEGLDPSSIETVMSESNVTRQKAVRALKKADGDVVNAILSLAS